MVFKGEPMFNQSPSITEISASLTGAGLIDPLKNKQNPHLRNRYADLASVLEVVRPALQEVGICLLQSADLEMIGGVLCRVVTTRLQHKSGEWIAARAAATEGDPLKGTSAAQAAGSSITYLKRYGLLAILGLNPDDDDDGHAAGQRRQQQQQQQQRQQAAPAPAPLSAAVQEAARKLKAQGVPDERIGAAIEAGHDDDHALRNLRALWPKR